MGYNTASNRAEYTAASGQTNFPFSFKVYENTDIRVYITPDGDIASDTNDIKTLNVDYTVTIDGDNGGSVVLLTGATLNDKITILRALPVKRDIDYQTSGDLLADTLNNDQNYQTYMIADQDGRQDRYVQLPESAQNVSGTLPAPAPDQYIRWSDDATELINDETYPAAIQTAIDNATAAGISASAAAQSAQEASDDKDTVVAKEALVNPHYTAIDTVAANIGDVNTVAADIAHVIKVSEDLSEAVSEVETVANDLNETVSEIETVANAVTNVDIVGTNINNVNNVGNNIGAVNNVNTNMAKVTTVNDNITNITTNANNITNINTNASNITNINAVANNTTNINAVNANAANINTVAGNSSNINTVSNNTTDIDTVATNITNVNAVGTDIANVNTVANNLVDVNAFADTYIISATEPASPFEGMLWADTTNHVVKEYNGTAFVAITADLNAVDAYLGTVYEGL